MRLRAEERFGRARARRVWSAVAQRVWFVTPKGEVQE